MIALIPKYLYHYSSVEKLGYIIGSEKIRFSRLDILNDPLEGLIDYREDTVFKKLVYVSCWNDQDEESINLWNMYTNESKTGVRIKVKNPIFGSYEDMGLYEHIDCYVPVCKIPSIQTTLAHNGRNNNEKIENVYGPIKITYIERSKLSMHSTGGDSVFLTELGLRKAREWSFESEWRFKLMFRDKLPIGLNEVVTDSHYDIPFNVENIIEVLTSPNMSNKEIECVKAILGKFGLNDSVAKSSLRIRAKNN